jgi:hypothetical protein
MCNKDHEVQTISLTCPDAVAFRTEATADRPAEIFYSMTALVQQATPEVLSLAMKASESGDQVAAAYALGVADFLRGVLASHETLLLSSTAFDINDLRDLGFTE